MRTKQIRLNDSEQIRRRMPEFVGKKINIVLHDRTAMIGELRKIDGDKIVLRNMRLENMKYPFQDIAEVYLDQKV
jgi:ribosome maturation factor RimP